MADDCMNCCQEGEAKKLKTAFQMACLKYEANPICFRGQTLTRRAMIELRRHFLEEEWSTVLQQRPLIVAELIERGVKYDENSMKMFYQNLENKLYQHRKEWQHKSLLLSERSQAVPNEQLEQCVPKLSLSTVHAQVKS